MKNPPEKQLRKKQKVLFFLFFCRFCLVFVFFLFLLELYGCSSDIFLSSRLRTDTGSIGNEPRILLYYAGNGFPERPQRPENLLNKMLYSEKSRKPLQSLQIRFAFHDRGWTSANLVETLSAQRSPVILTRLAPLARASEKLYARRNNKRRAHQPHGRHAGSFAGDTEERATTPRIGAPYGL